MKIILPLLLIIVAIPTFGQQHQLGLRVGDPFGITYKTPVSDKFSFEGILGRGRQSSGQYYRRTFENNRPVSSARYFAHQASGALSLHVRGVYEESFSEDFDISEGDLVIYAGLGIQFRSVRLDYYYTTPNATTNATEIVESRTNIDLGPEIFLGSAYYLEDLPIAIFVELGFLTEIVDRLHLKGQGAIGVRYLFGN